MHQLLWRKVVVVREERLKAVVAVLLLVHVERLVHAVGVEQQLVARLEREGLLAVLGRLEGAQEQAALLGEPLPLAALAVAQQREVVPRVNVGELARGPVQRGGPHRNEHARVVVGAKMCVCGGNCLHWRKAGTQAVVYLVLCLHHKQACGYSLARYVCN